MTKLPAKVGSFLIGKQCPYKYTDRQPETWFSGCLLFILIMLDCSHQKIAPSRRIVAQGRCLALGCRIVRWRGVLRR